MHVSGPTSRNTEESGWASNGCSDRPTNVHGPALHRGTPAGYGDTVLRCISLGMLRSDPRELQTVQGQVLMRHLVRGMVFG